MNFVPLNSPELSLLKFLPLTYHHSHFLAATLDFTSFFTMAFLRAAPFFTAWMFLIRYHFFLYLYTAKPAYGWLWGFFNPCVFIYHRKKKRTYRRFLILQLFLILLYSNYTNYIHIKTHGSVSCGPRSRRVTPVSILTRRKKTQFSHLRSSVLP